MSGDGQYRIYSHGGTFKGCASTPGGAVKRPSPSSGGNSGGGGIWGPLMKRQCGGSGGFWGCRSSDNGLSGGINGGVNGGVKGGVNGGVCGGYGKL
ncbi:hypothetical protein [Orf virus]|nr:hypothetical protein [Orf virus]